MLCYVTFALVTLTASNAPEAGLNLRINRLRACADAVCDGKWRHLANPYGRG